MACHAELSKWLKLDVLFCDPRAMRQRGSKKNTNSQPSRFLPNGTGLSLPSQTLLDDVARLLNGRPLSCLIMEAAAHL